MCSLIEPRILTLDALRHVALSPGNAPGERSARERRWAKMTTFASC